MGNPIRRLEAELHFISDDDVVLRAEQLLALKEETAAIIRQAHQACAESVLIRNRTELTLKQLHQRRSWWLNADDPATDKAGPDNDHQ